MKVVKSVIGNIYLSHGWHKEDSNFWTNGLLFKCVFGVFDNITKKQTDTKVLVETKSLDNGDK